MSDCFSHLKKKKTTENKLFQRGIRYYQETPLQTSSTQFYDVYDVKLTYITHV